MNNNTRKIISGLLAIIAILIVLLGLASENYLISTLGLALIVVMLVLRSLYIRKLNKQIQNMKKGPNSENDDNQGA